MLLFKSNLFKSPFSLTFINLETGNVIQTDAFSVIDRGAPSGYVCANNLTMEEWIEALQKALNKGA